MTSSRRIGPSPDRLEWIDSLRGLALSAVLLVNLYSLTLWVFVPASERAAQPMAAFDKVFRSWVLPALFHHRALTLLSLLFGWGLAAQLQSEGADTDADDKRHKRLFFRRILFLGCLGLVHTYLLWWGDVLLIYALLAPFLIPFRKTSSRTLLWWGVSIAIILPAALDPLIGRLITYLPSRAEMFTANLRIFEGESYWELLHQNAVFRAWLWVALWQLLFFVLGRFLIGSWAWRSGYFQDPQKHRPQLWRLFVCSAFAGGLGTAIELKARVLQEVAPFNGIIGGWLLRALVLMAPLALGGAYACGFALLYLRPKWRKPLSVLAPFGRMALTNYVTHTLVGLAVFYGIGLGFKSRLGFPAELGTWAAVFVAQLLFSRVWLQHFRFGPIEWLWRSFTYGTAQPLRRATSFEKR